MAAVPPVAEALVAVVLLLAIRRAFFGAPPTRTDPFAAAGWLTVAILLLVAVSVAADAGSRVGLVGLAVLASCAAGWWLRGCEEDGGADRGSDDPVDWDAFDRARDRWRPRDRAGI